MDREKQIHKLPEAAIISITESCNSKCSFCNIWQIEKPVELPIDIVDKLPTSLKNVDITGGEPLLHKNFSYIIEKFVNKKCNVIINTNGLVNLRKYAKLWEYKNLGIRFSLDGIGDKHDELRGIKGNFNNIMKQIDYLKSLRFNNIGISCTFSDANIAQAMDLYLLSKKIKVDFTCMAVSNSGIYYKKSDNALGDIAKFRDNIREIIKKEIYSFNLKKWGKACYMEWLLEFLNGKMKKINCSAGSNFFFMLPTGDIYPCNMRNLHMGNLKNESFEDLWFSRKSESIKLKTYDCTKPCWTMCNAKKIMLQNKTKFLFKLLGTFVRNV